MRDFVSRNSVNKVYSSNSRSENKFKIEGFCFGFKSCIFTNFPKFRGGEKGKGLFSVPPHHQFFEKLVKIL